MLLQDQKRFTILEVATDWIYNKLQKLSHWLSIQYIPSFFTPAS